MNIIINNDQKNIIIDDNLIKKMKKLAIIAINIIENKDDYELSILITNNFIIKNINNKYKKINKATDVLSFASFKDKNNEEPLFLPKYKNIILGDIVISAEKAKKQSIQFNHSFSREMLYLLTHGILHLYGYNHNNRYNKNKMRILEEKILFKIDSNKINKKNIILNFNEKKYV